MRDSLKYLGRTPHFKNGITDGKCIITNDVGLEVRYTNKNKKARFCIPERIN